MKGTCLRGAFNGLLSVRNSVGSLGVFDCNGAFLVRSQCESSFGERYSQISAWTPKISFGAKRSLTNKVRTKSSLIPLKELKNGKRNNSQSPIDSSSNPHPNPIENIKCIFMITSIITINIPYLYSVIPYLPGGATSMLVTDVGDELSW